jgi:hypothetical protein
MRRYTDYLLFLPAIFTLPALTVSAQQSPYVVGSTLTGHVICGDTNAPARFAKVFLKSTTPDHTGEDFMKRLEENMQKAAAKNGAPAKPIPPPTEEQQRARAAAARSMSQATDMLNASTVGLDGAYSFAGIKPGTYYVHAVYSGYIDPFDEFAPEELDSTDPAVHARILARVPTITVTGTDAARADLRLDRGAVVSGRVFFDDGTPATGWFLSVIKPKSAEEDSSALAANMSQLLALGKGSPVPMTDDVGHYRIAGLPAGDYLLVATLHATALGISASNIADGGSGISLAVYTGNTFSRADAKPFSLIAGEERSGMDIIIPAHSLHNIVGHVTAKTDGHALNSGDITLTSKDNSKLHLKAAIRDDGSFHYEYLPPGVYTIKVDEAADSKTTGSPSNFMGMAIPKQEITHKYGTATTDVVLGDADIDSVHLTVAEISWTPPEKKADTESTPGGLLDGLLGAGSDDKH